jgi:hypothetical protein
MIISSALVAFWVQVFLGRELPGEEVCPPEGRQKATIFIYTKHLIR